MTDPVLISTEEQLLSIGSDYYLMRKTEIAQSFHRVDVNHKKDREMIINFGNNRGFVTYDDILESAKWYLVDQNAVSRKAPSY